MNDQFTIVVLALGYWAKGPTINKAMEALYLTGCRKTERVTVKLYTGKEEDVWVDDSGYIHYNNPGELLDLTDYGQLIKVVL